MHNAFQVEQRIREFDARHGDSAKGEGFIYYEDGAVREAGMGALIEPPAERRHRWRNIVCYHQIKLQRLVQELNTLVAELEVSLTHGFTGPLFDEKTEKAKKLKTQIRQRQRNLEKAEAEQRKHQPGYMPPTEAGKYAADEAEEYERRRAELEKLKI